MTTGPIVSAPATPGTLAPTTPTPPSRRIISRTPRQTATGAVRVPPTVEYGVEPSVPPRPSRRDITLPPISRPRPYLTTFVTSAHAAWPVPTVPIPSDRHRAEPVATPLETWTSTHLNFIGVHARRSTDRIYICEFDVREVQIPVVVVFDDGHGQHLDHSLVHLLNASVTVGLVGACSKLARSRKLIHSW